MFNDKYDVFNWYLCISMRSSLAQIGVHFSWDAALVRFFRVMDANRGVSLAFFASEAPTSPRFRFVEYVEACLANRYFGSRWYGLAF